MQAQVTLLDKLVGLFDQVNDGIVLHADEVVLVICGGEEFVKLSK
jgi:hypothetical protein